MIVYYSIDTYAHYQLFLIVQHEFSLRLIEGLARTIVVLISFLNQS